MPRYAGNGLGMTMRQSKGKYSKKRGNSDKTQSKRELNVFKYPFSTATLAAKIPDGAATLSSAQRFQTSDALVCPKGANYIILTPSLVAPVWYFTGIGAGGGPGTGGGIEHGLGTALESVTETAEVGLLYNPNTNGATVSPIAPDTWKELRFAQQLSDGEIPVELSKWRLISSGIKLSLINNSDSNDGYFEAIRFTSGLTQGGNVDQSILRAELANIVTSSMIDQPSYVAGKLRDIHKYQFQLKPDGINHDFQDNKAYLDNGFDMVLIRIQGRDDQAGGDTSKTQLLAHAVSNQEMVYSITSKWSRFHTESNYNKNYSTRFHASNIDIRAATKKLVG